MENIRQFCWKYSSSFQQWKNFENRLRFEKVIAKSLVASFFWNTVYLFNVHGGRVVRCRTCDREVASSNPTRGCCVPTPTQRAIPPGSVNEYQRKLGVNGHTTRYTGPVSVVLRLRLVSGWGLRKRRSAPPHGPLRLGEGLYLLFYYLFI